MKQLLQETWHLLRQCGKDFMDANPFGLSAGIAFYTIFSLPGIAIITIMVAAGFYEREVVREELINQVSLIMGQSSADQIESVMSAATLSSDSLIMKMVGIITLLISTTTVFVSLQQSINTIWKIKPKPKKGLFKFLINRLISLAMVASIGFLLLVSLMADTLMAILKDALSNIIADGSYYLIWALNVGISLVFITMVFALIYKVLPDAQIKWKHVWTGAIFTTLLFVIGKYLIGYYLTHSNMGEAYGAAGSLVALLTWVYYSVIIILFGAQFTFTYNKIKSRVIMPNKDSVAVRLLEIEKEDESVTKIQDQ